MHERTYELYAKDSGPYEIVPSGWSLLPATLQLFWAISNGVLGKYFLLGIPLIALGVLNGLVSQLFSYVALAYIFIAFYVYFPTVAFSWRAQVLRSRGYHLRSSIKAASSKAALRKYAESES